MSKIRHFHKMATDHGTDLNTALTNYTGMEQKLRADPVAGLDMIVNNLNLRTPEGEKIGFRDIAYHVLSQSPDQLRQLQMGNQQHAANQQIGALHSQIQHLQSWLRSSTSRSSRASGALRSVSDCSDFESHRDPAARQVWRERSCARRWSLRLRS